MERDELKGLTPWIGRASWIIKKLPGRLGKNLVSAVKKEALIKVSTQLHQDVVHSIRHFSSAIKVRKDVGITRSAIEICTKCRELICDILTQDRGDIHCCLKVLPQPQSDDKKAEFVGTLGRSEPFIDDRPMKDDFHLVKKNSVWCALMKEHDSDTNWPLFKCFTCNDLEKHRKIFHCSRDDWSDYYKSTFVLPIYYMTDPGSLTCTVSGFLAFDSPYRDVFRGMPDIYDYREDPTKYMNLLQESTVFQLGALIADTLGIAFEPLCDINKLSDQEAEEPKNAG